jgi:hypothetical protein
MLTNLKPLNIHLKKIHLEQGLAFPTTERIDKLKLPIQKMYSGQTIALYFLHILGMMASCMELILNARLHMKPVQLHLLSFWNPICKDMTIKIPFTQHLRSHLTWWTNSANMLKGQSLVSPKINITVTTDTSR